MQLPPDTARLRFRTWKDADLNAFAAMNSDAGVMRYFPALLTKEESRDMMQRIRHHFDEEGFGLYAVEKKDDGSFMGFIGFSTPRFESFFTPCIEIGWRLAAAHWGKGYAAEGARACLAFGFSELDFSEVYSFTAVVNQPSERVMIKAGMQRAGEFEHPLLVAGHWLRPHVLYRLRASDVPVFGDASIRLPSL